MNPLSSSFAHLYVASGVLGAFAVMLRMTGRMSSGRQLFSAALVVPLVMLYLVGMHRSAGVDFDTYSAAYTEEGLPIPDLGYTALTFLTRRLGIGFSTFLLLQGIFTLAVLWVVSKEKEADAVVVVVVYLLHLAIVRDLSQSRIGLATAVYLLGQTQQRSTLRAALYLFAASIHITVIVLMFIWTFARLTARLKGWQQVIVVYLPMVAFAVYGIGLLNMASALDPRVEIYLSWDDVGYGAPLESFGALFRSALVLGIYGFAAVRFPGLRLRPYVLVELAGAAILVGFAEFSIFAARLSNVAISMYPIGLGIVASEYRRRRVPARGEVSSVAVRLATGAALALLIVRPGSYDALLEVVPTAFEWMTGW